MAVRNLKVRYIGSSFGSLWSILNPVSHILIYGLVFGTFLKFKPDPAVYGTDKFFIFLVCGLIPWQFFVQTVFEAPSLILSNANLVKKSVGFPAEILPIVSLLTNIIDHLIGIMIIFSILLLFKIKITFFAATILIYLIFICIFALGISWLLASLNVYLRDIQQFLQLVMMSWFYLTPIFYSVNILPAWVMPIMKWNPMLYVVEGYRMALLRGQWLPLKNILYLGLCALLSFSLGGLVFKKLKSGFAEVL